MSMSTGTRTIQWRGGYVTILLQAIKDADKSGQGELGYDNNYCFALSSPNHMDVKIKLFQIDTSMPQIIHWTSSLWVWVEDHHHGGSLSLCALGNSEPCLSHRQATGIKFEWMVGGTSDKKGPFSRPFESQRRSSVSVPQVILSLAMKRHGRTVID